MCLHIIYLRICYSFYFARRLEGSIQLSVNLISCKKFKLSVVGQFFQRTVLAGVLGLPVKSLTEMTETESFSRGFHEIFQLEVEHRVFQAVPNYNGGINCNITVFAPQQRKAVSNKGRRNEAILGHQSCFCLGENHSGEHRGPGPACTGTWGNCLELI